MSKRQVKSGLDELDEDYDSDDDIDDLKERLATAIYDEAEERWDESADARKAEREAAQLAAHGTVAGGVVRGERSTGAGSSSGAIQTSAWRFADHEEEWKKYIAEPHADGRPRDAFEWPIFRETAGRRFLQYRPAGSWTLEVSSSSSFANLAKLVSHQSHPPTIEPAHQPIEPAHQPIGPARTPIGLTRIDRLSIDSQHAHPIQYQQPDAARSLVDYIAREPIPAQGYNCLLATHTFLVGALPSTLRLKTADFPPYQELEVSYLNRKLTEANYPARALTYQRGAAIPPACPPPRTIPLPDLDGSPPSVRSPSYERGLRGCRAISLSQPRHPQCGSPSHERGLRGCRVVAPTCTDVHKFAHRTKANPGGSHTFFCVVCVFTVQRGSRATPISLEQIVESTQSLLIAGTIRLPSDRNSEFLTSLPSSIEHRTHFYGWNPALRVLYIGAGDANQAWASGCFHIPREDLKDVDKMSRLKDVLLKHGVERFSSAHALRVDATRLAHLPFSAPQHYADIARTDTYAAPLERPRRH